MQKWVLCFVFLLVSGAPVSSYEGDISRVSILTSSFETLQVVDQPADLETFDEMWSNKSVVRVGDVPAWDYKIDIQKDGRVTRWLYSSTSGTCTVLSKKETPVYVLEEYEQFNVRYGL